jgi:hypothetical protein
VTRQFSGGTGRASGQFRGEAGSAIVEFYFLGIVLLVPLVYIMLTLLDVQRTAYGVTQAAREAGRLLAATGDEQAALAAAAISLDDQGVAASDVELTFECSTDPCFAPGGEITVTVAATVHLPLLPDVFADAANAQIPVQGTHAAAVDRYRSDP